MNEAFLEYNAKYFDCPTCGAIEQEPCKSKSGVVLRKHHVKRVSLVRDLEAKRENLANEVFVVRKDPIKGFLLKRGERQVWVSRTAVFKMSSRHEEVKAALDIEECDNRFWYKVRSQARKLMMEGDVRC